MRSKLLLWNFKLPFEKCHSGGCVGEGLGEEGHFGYILNQDLIIAVL